MSESKTATTVRHDIEQFLSLVGNDSFTSDQIDKQFNFNSREAKHWRWRILEQDLLARDHRIEKLGTGKYRLVNTTLEEVDWWNADIEDTVKITWPLNLHKYVKTYHRSIIIIAGSPGAGKTAFLYNFLLRNMGNKMGEYLFTNDMTPEEIKERLINAAPDIEIPSPPPFKIFDRADNFGDVIEPNAINIVDYLDLNSELYLIGEEIEKIYRKLDRGIALVAIQKKPNQEVGVGGMFSSKRSKLYLAMDGVKVNGELMHKLTIHKARGRVDPKINPKSLEFTFKLAGGIRFQLNGTQAATQGRL